MDSAKSKARFRLKLVTRAKVLIDQEVRYASVPTVVGPIGILPGHAPLVGMLSLGVLGLRDMAEKELSVFVEKGFFMITRDSVLLVTGSAEQADPINRDPAVAAKEWKAKSLESEAS